ncbi:hypothetical protein BKA61DRAFT_678069 [Leptodontidium sp. MPI-SDFR-AT-0119]|nr:hypothetical protein BKA61DRAFT_678069 [Leptodontidium sp. MPI-SDFR-AT-0119]
MDKNVKSQGDLESSSQLQILAETTSRMAIVSGKATGATTQPAVSPDICDEKSVLDGDQLTDYEYYSYGAAHDSDDSFHNREDVPITEREIVDLVDMGEMIAVAYPVGADYDVNDERHMFDDGLSGDDGDDLPEDNSTDGDTSSNYEELAKGVRGESDCEGGDGKEEKELEVDESEVTSNAEEEKVADISIISGSEYDDDTSIDTTDIDTTPTKAQTTPDKAPLPQVKMLTDLRKANIMLTKQAEARDKLHWKVKELQEMIREIERQIPEAESNLQAAQGHLESNKEQFKGDLIASGLSPELFEAFSDFCESLYPKYGLREGFSVDLEGKHGGSYVEYDPTFKIFKDNVETDYKTCNFRCEATTVEDSWLMDEEDGTYESEEIDIVQFFPIRSPEPVAGPETTWGMQYPVLYDLAFKAAEAGSLPALDMFIRLPGINGKLNGWLFEYKPDCMLHEEPIISRRWIFCCSHEIDKPISPEAKKCLLMLKTL